MTRLIDRFLCSVGQPDIGEVERLGRRRFAALVEQQAVDASRRRLQRFAAQAVQPERVAVHFGPDPPGCGDSSRMRLPTTNASSMEWVTNSRVKRTSSHRRSSSSCIFRRVSASSAANGSSISRIFGCIASARAIATRAFMPPDSVCG